MSKASGLTYTISEIRTSYKWISKVLLGPAADHPASPDDYLACCRDFEAQLVALDRPGAVALFRWWLERFARMGDMPTREERWQIDLAAVAPRLFLREWIPGTKTIRYRYCGEVLEQLFGGTMTLKDSVQFAGQTEDAHFENLSPLFVKGHFFFSWLDFSMSGRGFVKGTSLELPLRAIKDGAIRYSIGAVDPIA